MRDIIGWLHDWHGLTPAQHREHLYQLDHSACVYHLIKVISGMDSMVIGEPQVAGQAKQSWQAARMAGTLDSQLDRLYQHAFAAAKRVRNETGIGRNPVSLPFAALRLARRIFGTLDDRRALLVGAGEMIEHCAEHFRDAGVESLTIVNRSAERACQLAGRFGARAYPLSRLAGLLADHDLVIACTGSAEPIIAREHVERALKQRRRQPIFALDLAVPRNIAASCAALDDFYLYTIDDLHAIVESAQSQRLQALTAATDIVEEEVGGFERWLRLQRTTSTLKSVRQRAQRERDELIARARQELARGDDTEVVMRRLGHRLVNRLLHVPSIKLRQAAEAGDEDMLAAARFYFLDDET